MIKMTDEIKIEPQPKEDSSYINVQPKGEIISQVQIECRVILNDTMYCFIHCYDINKIKIKLYQVPLSPDEYSNWVDDNELQNLILSKVGLVKL